MGAWPRKEPAAGPQGVSRMLSHTAGALARVTLSRERPAMGGPWDGHMRERLCLPFLLGLKAGQRRVHLIEQDKSAV